MTDEEINKTVEMVVADADKKFPTILPEKELNRRKRKDEREGRKISRIIRLTRWLPKIKIPKEAIDYVVAQARTRATNAWSFMQMERNLGSFYYRKNIKLSDVELDDMVAKNQIALMNTAREYSIVYDWLLLSGRLVEYGKFRDQVEVGIRAMIEAEHAPAKGPGVPIDPDLTADPKIAHQPSTVEVHESEAIKAELDERRLRSMEAFK
jgi:hypothetical protein